MASVEEILHQLDGAAETMRFPMLGHPYSCLVTARLHAYSDGTRWAMVVEVSGYSQRAANLDNVLHVFGDCLLGPIAVGPTMASFRRIDNNPMEDDEETLEPVLVEPIILRGRTIEVEQVGDEDMEDILRRLLPDHRELMLADEAELRSVIPADLPEVLRLDEWHHTDMEATPPWGSQQPELVFVQSQDGRQTAYRETPADVEARRRRWETLTAVDRRLGSGEPSPAWVRPSTTETYPQIALVLATGDPSHYRPTCPPNIHWSDWPESGSL